MQGSAFLLLLSLSLPPHKIVKQSLIFNKTDSCARKFHCIGMETSDNDGNVYTGEIRPATCLLFIDHHK